MRRISFVDDDSDSLNGLRRMLRPLRDEWGIDVSRHVVLSTSVFAQLDPDVIKSMELAKVWAGWARIGLLAKAIALDLPRHKVPGEDAVKAGMICDLGKLVLLSARPGVIMQIRNSPEGRPEHERNHEKQHLGFSHADVGACLIALWDLPDTIVQAAAYHHSPDQCISNDFEALTAVHIASSLASTPSQEKPVGLDLDYLERLELSGKIPQWREMHDGMVTA